MHSFNERQTREISLFIIRVGSERRANTAPGDQIFAIMLSIGTRQVGECDVGVFEGAHVCVIRSRCGAGWKSMGV